MLSVFIIVVMVNYVYTSNILGVFQFPSLSHQIVYQSLWRELSLHGHQVTVVTPFPLKDKSLTNLTEIDVSYVQDTVTPSESIEKTMSKDVATTDAMKAFYKLSEKIEEEIFKNPEFIELYNNSDNNFDLIIVECLHPGMYSLAGKFNAPTIGISSLGVVVATHESVGNTNHPVLYPDMNLPFHENLPLKEKIYSFYFSLWSVYYYNNIVIANADQIARKYLGNNIPYLGELARNVSLIFINTNHVLYNIRPNIPTVIELGRMHIRSPRPLPQDLQDILDDAKEGAIYFSLGSNVKSANLSKRLKEIIIEVLSELPYKILWKWESGSLPGNPKNVIIKKWLPQQDVLAHPNVKAFITQGGLQSIEEAISRGVPMVGMPFIGDQPMNVKKMVKAGIAVEVDPSTLNKDELKRAILEVAENIRYKSRIEEVRDTLNDEPLTGLEKAVWWIDYVIRHNGTKHLRSPTADIPLYEYLLLDVIGVFLGILLLVGYIVNKIFCLIYKSLFLSTIRKIKST